MSTALVASVGLFIAMALLFLFFSFEKYFFLSFGIIICGMYVTWGFDIHRCISQGSLSTRTYRTSLSFSLSVCVSCMLSLDLLQ